MATLAEQKAKRDALVTKMNGFLTQAQVLSDSVAGEDSVPKAISDQINSLLGKADEAQSSIQLHDRMSKGIEFLEESRGTVSEKLNWRQAAPDEGEAPVDEKAWRELEFKVGREEIKIRYNVPLNVQHKDYPEVYNEYLRKGFGDISPAARKTLNLGTDTAGGFTVPEEMQMSMLKKTAAQTVFRRYARVVQTSRDRIKWPRLRYVSASDDSSGQLYTSAVRMTWTGEQPASSTAHRATDPQFGLVDIPVHTAMASIPLTLDVIEDSAFDLEGLVADLLGEAFGLGEENTFWNGNGAGQPLGILHANSVDTTEGISSINSGHASLLQADGLIDLIYGLPSQYEQGARVFWKKETEKAVRKLKINATDTEYVWPVEERVGAFGVADPTILGFPISRAEFVPSVGAGTYPIVFGQLSGYFVVDRVGMSIQRLEEAYAEQNLIVLLARKRVGGQIVENWRLKAQKISA